MITVQLGNVKNETVKNCNAGSIVWIKLRDNGLTEGKRQKYKKMR